MTEAWDDAVAHFIAEGPIGVLTIDASFVVVHANSTANGILGRDVIGLSILDLLYEDDIDRVIAASMATPEVRRTRPTSGDDVPQPVGRGIVFRMTLADGRPIEVLAHTATVRVGGVTYTQMGILPAPPRLAVLEALAGVAAARPLATTFETLMRGIADGDSGVAVNWVDIDGEVHVFGNLNPLLSGVDGEGKRDPDVATPWFAAAQQRTPARLKSLDTIRTDVADVAREAGYVACVVSPVDDPATGLALLYINWVRHRTQLAYAQQTFADVLADVFQVALDRAEDARRMHHAAHHDQLTGLGNRGAFFDALAGAVAAGPVSVLYLDLDLFKPINDRLGHEAGDRALMAVAERLRTCAPTGAFTARLGGDEFATVVPNDDGRRAEALADRLLSEMAQPLELAEYGSVAVGVSIGIATSDANPVADPNALVVAADEALRAAKGDGKGTWVRHQSRVGPP